jgi:hypothetical protein
MKILKAGVKLKNSPTWLAVFYWYLPGLLVRRGYGHDTVSHREFLEMPVWFSEISLLLFFA